MKMNDGASTIRSHSGLRRGLGIPDSATYVLILDQSAHCDWDWRRKFRDYLELTGPVGTTVYGVAQLLDAAIDNLTDAGYRYSFCEVGYLQAYLELPGKLGQLAALAAAGSRFRIVGGGITSPDCLLSAGEAFLRNYLVGKLWLAQHLPGQLPLRQCWIPDDFGQDPELPVSLAAMGMTSVGFSRLPGLGPIYCPEDPTYYQNDLLANGADFTWQASDGASQIFTHWMPGGVPGYYSPGGDLRSAQEPGSKITPVEVLTAFLASNNFPAVPQPPYSAAPSNYVYLPIDADFMLPLPQLSTVIAEFNAGAGAQLGVHAVAASFADFAELALAASPTLKVRRYNGTPVWTGIYASRPALKTLHYQATRTMLAAETLGLLAYGHRPDTAAAGGHWTGVAAAWNELVPSTHHDYITGTSSDSTDTIQTLPAQNVVYEEQLPLLTRAADHATSLVSSALAALAARTPTGEWVVVNPDGVRYAGPIELTGELPDDVQSIRIGNRAHRMQRTATGGVFTAELPSLARVTAAPSVAPVERPIAEISPTNSGASSYTLSNEHLSLVVSAAADWGIALLADAAGGQVIGSGRRGNDLRLWADGGNLYQFGNELTDGSAFEDQTQVAAHGTATVVETGSLRVVLTVPTTFTFAGGETGEFLRTYELVAGEPFVRMTTTGTAPTACSVMTSFGLPAPVESIWHGTANHWTTAQPVGTDKLARPGLKPLWGPPVFRPTHDWLLARNGSATMAAVYHPGVPAWGFDGDGNLLGCLLRNTPGNQRGAMGTDADVHTVQYALRVPAGLGDPSTGQVFREARNYATPPVSAAGSASAVEAAGGPPRILARVDAPGVIRAVKPSDTRPGTLVLRLYQPTNAACRLTVTLGGGRPESVQVVTALEDPIPETEGMVVLTETGFTIDMPAALATVQVVPRT
ncbi:MAG: hypothetical protein JO144_16655 [Actinobacteria bacterium]|nr:hypothetical protein [Actinomycetota bacterium]